MGQILQKWRIPIAVLFSAVLILGAYLLARGFESPQVAEASAETALLQAIASKDSDGDGLSDWEEALYGTSPSAADTLKLGMTDGEAVSRGLIVPKAIADIPIATSSPFTYSANGLPPPPPEGTLTAAFSQNFFTLYLSAREANGGGNLSESQMNEVANQALSSLSSSIKAAPNYKSAKDIAIAGSGADALKAFAVQAEAVLKKNTSSATDNELGYLGKVVKNSDATALPYIAAIAKGYRDSAVGLAVLTVPEELAASDLLLINSMMRVSQIISDFARVNDDPLAAILALQQYPQVVVDIGQAFINIGKIYRSAGIILPAGTPGAAFVNLIDDLAASQRAAKKP